MRQFPRKTGFTKTELLLVVVIIIIIGTVASPKIANGKGDSSRARQLALDLGSLTTATLAQKYGHAFLEIRLEDGIVHSIAEDSHTSDQGGNLAIQFGTQTPEAFVGHVCGEIVGPNYRAMIHGSTTKGTVAEFQKYFGEILKNGFQQVSPL